MAKDEANISKTPVAAISATTEEVHAIKETDLTTGYRQGHQRHRTLIALKVSGEVDLDLVHLHMAADTAKGAGTDPRLDAVLRLDGDRTVLTIVDVDTTHVRMVIIVVIIHQVGLPHSVQHMLQGDTDLHVVQIIHTTNPVVVKKDAINLG